MNEPRPRRSAIVEVDSLDGPWDSNAVAESVRHILDELEIAAEAISGWSSFIDKDAAGE